MNPQYSLPSYDLDHVFGYDSLVHSVHMLCTQPNAGSCKWQVAGCRLQKTCHLPLATCHLQPATCNSSGELPNKDGVCRRRIAIDGWRLEPRFC